MPDPETPVRRSKDGRTWRIGADAEITWIRENTGNDRSIATAIPLVFEAYATLELPGSGVTAPGSSIQRLRTSPRPTRRGLIDAVPLFVVDPAASPAMTQRSAPRRR